MTRTTLAQRRAKRAGVWLRFSAIWSLLLMLAACGSDPEQVRLCRSLIGAFEPEARALQALPPEVAQAAGYDVKIAFTAGAPRDASSTPREGWIACRFADGGAGRLTLAAVATDRQGALDAAALFWLEKWREIYARQAVEARHAGDYAFDAERPRADDPMLGVLYFAQQTINAAALGGVYALLALSFTLVYGLIGRINFAFGEFYMLGAVLSGVWLAGLATLGLGGWAAALGIVLAPCLGALALGGWLTGRVVFQPLQSARGHAPIIAAIGLSIARQEGVRLLHGARDVWVPVDLSGRIVLAATQGFDVVANWKQIGVVALCGTVVLLLLAVLRWSRFGLVYRACADDAGAAVLLGVDSRRVLALTFALGGGLAGLAGFALLQYYGVANFFMGFLPGFKALTAAILGGIGSVPGAILGGVLIAVLEIFWAGYLSADYKDVAVFGLLALVLIFRPSGLLGVEAARIAQPDRA